MVVSGRRSMLRLLCAVAVVIAWRGVACGVAWRGVAWRGVAWRGVWRGVAWRFGWIWPKRTLPNFTQNETEPEKDKRAPLMRFHIGFAVSKNPQGNEPSPITTIPFYVR